jgi:hypothetical protein
MNSSTIVFFIDNVENNNLIRISSDSSEHTFLKQDIFYDIDDSEETLLIETKSTKERFMFDVSKIGSISTEIIKENSKITGV